MTETWSIQESKARNYWNARETGYNT